MEETMKKIIGVCVAAVLAANVYAFDDNFELKTVGSVAEYTKIDYTITEKFGDYYRSPKAKYVHVFDASGKQIESDELTSKDSLVDKILYNYDSEGRVTSTVCTDGDGKIQWKSIFTYDGDGNKIDSGDDDGRIPSTLRASRLRRRSTTQTVPCLENSSRSWTRKGGTWSLPSTMRTVSLS